tara:strand:- start:287 stop:463 length:177 start_codon:yes stop_codon:yes gene_type:complete
MPKSQAFFSTFFILAMTNLQRIFSLSVNLIIPKGITEKPKSQEKLSTIFLHNPAGVAG